MKQWNGWMAQWHEQGRNFKLIWECKANDLCAVGSFKEWFPISIQYRLDIELVGCKQLIWGASTYLTGLGQSFVRRFRKPGHLKPTNLWYGFNESWSLGADVVGKINFLRTCRNNIACIWVRKDNSDAWTPTGYVLPFSTKYITTRRSQKL